MTIEENRQKNRERKAKWRLANPEKVAEQNAKRREQYEEMTALYKAHKDKGSD